MPKTKTEESEVIACYVPTRMADRIRREAGLENRSVSNWMRINLARLIDGVAVADDDRRPDRKVAA